MPMNLSEAMSDFARWSKWFACGSELGANKTNALALMAWIAAHAASDGKGVEFDERVWLSLTRQTGLTAEEGRDALDALIAHGLVTAVGQEKPGHLIARAVL